MIPLIHRQEVMKTNRNSGKAYDNRQQKLRHELYEAKTVEEFQTIKKRLDLSNTTNRKWVEKYEPIIRFNCSRMSSTMDEKKLSLKMLSVLCGEKGDSNVISYDIEHLNRLYIGILGSWDKVNTQRLWGDLCKKVKDGDLPWSVDQAIVGLESCRQTGRIMTQMELQIRKMNIKQLCDMIAAIALNNRVIGDMSKYINEEKRLRLEGFRSE